MAWHWALLVMLLITWIPGLPYVRVIVFDAQDITRSMLNSSGPTDAIWRWRSWSTLVQVMACCLTAPSHYLNQRWLIISKILWHSSGDIIIRFENYIYKIALRSPRGQWVNVCPLFCFVAAWYHSLYQYTDDLIHWHLRNYYLSAPIPGKGHKMMWLITPQKSSQEYQYNQKVKQNTNTSGMPHIICTVAISATKCPPKNIQWRWLRPRGVLSHVHGWGH